MKPLFRSASGAAALIAFTVLIAGPPALAHHSFAMFDNQKQVALSGTVREFQFTNPHCFIQLLVPEEGGKTVEWSIEMGAPAHLVRAGWTKTTVKPGDKITVQIHPLKDGGVGGSFVSATGANGKPL